MDMASQVTGAAPPAPNGLNQVGETVMGLGLAGFMLSGFLVVIALMITVPLFIAWYKRKSEDNSNGVEISRVPRTNP